MPASMSTTQLRVKERVEHIGQSAITLAKSVGLERGYINDLVIGRKRTIRNDKLSLVAKALQCDPEYLTGDQDEVRKPDQPINQPQPEGIPFGGVCETGSWRSETAAKAPDEVEMAPIEPDPRFPTLPHEAFLVRGNSMAGEGIVDGMLVVAVDLPGTPPPGSIAVCRRIRNATREVEQSLRLVELTQSGLVLRSNRGSAGSDPDRIYLNKPSASEKVQIVGIVTRAVKLFLSNSAM